MFQGYWEEGCWLSLEDVGVEVFATLGLNESCGRGCELFVGKLLVSFLLVFIVLCLTCLSIAHSLFCCILFVAGP